MIIFIIEVVYYYFYYSSILIMWVDFFPRWQHRWVVYSLLQNYYFMHWNACWSLPFTVKFNLGNSMTLISWMTADTLIISSWEIMLIVVNTALRPLLFCLLWRYLWDFFFPISFICQTELFLGDGLIDVSLHQFCRLNIPTMYI